ncbi:quattro [Triplophysa dalaica]|uniref:quattro n=1 Tax=Triplophysa dalaica TaxID=1582913 RepID=UPI0024E00EE4|nr:quattro [Triplophysa dalaica]
MNPSSLEWSIQSTLSALYPPFEATAPTVLSQLFRTIEERYHGDALQCLLDFLIPAKHILESVQQAACAAYSDVLFRCEGWPLCLSDRVVVQLAPINPLLLRPGDFYLQVEPFGDQSARIVLKSLLVQEDLLGQDNLVLQAGSRVPQGPEVEGIPIPETSYPSIFTKSWLREINEGRHGNHLHQCVLSSDRGVVKVPWTEISNPEFLDRPKANTWAETTSCMMATLKVDDLQTKISENVAHSQLPVDLLQIEMDTRILPAEDGTVVSVQLVEGGTRLVKVEHGNPISSFAGKPVGWVSPNTWDSRHDRELEGEYVDLLEFTKEKQTLNKIEMPTQPLSFKMVRTAQPEAKSNLCDEHFSVLDKNSNLYLQPIQPPESMQNNLESKCRYRQSYMAALRNPVHFERASMLRPVDESKPDVAEAEPSCERYVVGLQHPRCMSGQTPNQIDKNPIQCYEKSAQVEQSPTNVCQKSTRPSESVPPGRSSREKSPEQCPSQQSPDTAQAKHHKSHDLHETAVGNRALHDKRLPCLNDSIRQDQFQVRVGGQKHAKTQHLPKMGLRALPDHSGLRQDLCLRRLNIIQQNQLTQNSEQTSLLFQRQCSQIEFQNENSPSDYKIPSDDRQRGRDLDSPAQVLKVAGKSRPKFRSSSSVSETARECMQSHKATNRSHSDIYPGIIPTVSIIQGIKHTANLVSPKLTRRHERKVSLSGKLGTPAGNGGVLQDINNDQLQMSRTESAGQATLFSQDSTIKSLLQLGMICLPGSRDRAGRAVVEVYGGRKGWGATQHSPLDLCRLLLYLHSIPRMEVRDLGLTVVIDSRKSPLPSVFYKSLLLVQEQALHAVHTIVMLVEKDVNPRPERHPGLQIDVVTSLKALHKVVDAQQLTSDFGGNFPYSHEDWLQFHQKLSLFQLDLQAASSLLHAAIRKLDVKKTDSAQEVMSCIDEQRSSMKIVLEDMRLVALQREGGAILARMRKEEPRYVHSEDNRHSMESVTCLYNQVEEAVHTLVMKSNQSLQHLEHVLLLRETADTLDRIQIWCNAEEQAWKVNADKEETLPKLEQKLRDIQSVLIQAKEKKEKGMLLIKAVKRKRQETEFHETDTFRCTVTSFKTNMTGFLLRAEERKSELETSLDLYRFCEQASSLVKECMQYLGSVTSPACLSFSVLMAFEERFIDFSPQHFEEKREALLERHPDGIWMWNAVWAQCRDIRQRLREILQASYRNQSPPTSPQKEKVATEHANGLLESLAPNVFTTSTPEKGEGEPQTNPVGDHTENRNCHTETVTLLNIPFNLVQFTLSYSETQMDEREDNLPIKQHVQGLQQSFPLKEQSSPKVWLKDSGRPFHRRSSEGSVSTYHTAQTAAIRNCSRMNSHSDGDLRNFGRPDDMYRLARNRSLVSSCSEGSCASTSCSVSTSKDNATVKPMTQTSTHSSQKDFQRVSSPVSDAERASCDGQSSNLSYQDSFCSSVSQPSRSDSAEINNMFSIDTKSMISPVRTQDESISTPTSTLETNSTVLKLQLIIEELLKTEREYVRALWYVVEHYMPELERPDVPQDLRGQRGGIFGNLEKLRDFHQHHFLKELEICLQEPFGVGRCFLKHKENFGLYALYSKNKPCSEELLISHGKEFFKEKQQLLGDKMDLSSYLLKPVQRISKYSLLLQDMLRECDSGQHTGHERVEIQTALEIIQFQLRHGNDLLAMDDIQHCDVNLKEQGQLIRQDAFLLTFRKKKCQRHIFLFRDLILFSKTRKTDVGNDTYIYKQSFKTSDIGMTHNFGDSGQCFEIWFRRRKSQDTYILQAQSREVKENWTRDLERILWEQAIHNREIRMQERVFMGIGHKPFMDITPSEMAINDRAINCDLTGRGGLPVLRLNSTGSASCTSSSGSHSSSSSGWGSSVGHLIGPTSRDVVRFGRGTSGILEEEDVDQDSGSQSVLVDSSESSGESVSCFSSSGHSSHSVIGGCGEHGPSEVPVIGVKKLSAHKKESNRKPANPPIQPSSKVQGRNVMGKSTEV